MDSRELAVQQFDLIRKSVLENSSPGTEATAWLQKYAMPAIAEYWERPQFRKLATWSIRKLESSAASDERRFIDQLDSCIRRVCKTTLKLAAKPKVSRLIQEGILHPSSAMEVDDVFSDPDASTSIQSTRSAVRTAATHPKSLECFASGDFKLADHHDYFEPV